LRAESGFSTPRLLLEVIEDVISLGSLADWDLRALAMTMLRQISYEGVSDDEFPRIT